MLDVKRSRAIAEQARLHAAMLFLRILLPPTRFIAKQLIDNGLIKGIRELVAWNFIFYIMIAIFYTSSIQHIWAWINFSISALILLAIFAIWRANELIIAFFSDAIDKAGSAQSKFKLSNVQLLTLFLLGYIEIIFQFGVCHFCIYKIYEQYGDACAYTNMFQTAFDAANFSGTTVTTTGFGDFAPTRSFSRAITVYEAIVGVVLIAMSLSAYLSYKQASTEK